MTRPRHLFLTLCDTCRCFSFTSHQGALSAILSLTKPDIHKAVVQFVTCRCKNDDESHDVGSGRWDGTQSRRSSSLVNYIWPPTRSQRVDRPTPDECSADADGPPLPTDNCDTPTGERTAPDGVNTLIPIGDTLDNHHRVTREDEEMGEIQREGVKLDCVPKTNVNQ